MDCAISIAMAEFDTISKHLIHAYPADVEVGEVLDTEQPTVRRTDSLLRVAGAVCGQGVGRAAGAVGQSPCSHRVDALERLEPSTMCSTSSSFSGGHTGSPASKPLSPC